MDGGYYPKRTRIELRRVGSRWAWRLMDALGNRVGEARGYKTNHRARNDALKFKRKVRKDG